MAEVYIKSYDGDGVSAEQMVASVTVYDGGPGAVGPQGPQGEVGPQGIQGPTGADGADGAPGVVAATAPATYNSGTQTIGVSVGTTAGTVAAGDDSRLADSRTPTGSAGGVLSGTYPNPGFAADMATQAELDAHVNDTSAAHAASAISYNGAAGLSATDVEAALDELDTEKAAASHTHAQSDVTNLTTDLAAKVPIARTINAQTGTSYTLVLSDAGKFVTMSNAAASVLTIPPNSSVAYPIGTQIPGAQLGAGAVTVTPGSGVTLSGTPDLIGAQNQGFLLTKLGTDTWLCEWSADSSGGGGAVATDAIWDTKGDLAVATGANTAVKLPVGTTYQSLVPDSAQSGGLKWMKSAPRTADTIPVTAATQDDEFNDDTGMSGPVNGLNARWSKRNMATAGWTVLDAGKVLDGVLLEVPTGQAASQGYYQAAPAGDFTIQCRTTFLSMSDRQMWGLAVLDTNGTGVSVLFDDPGQDNVYMRGVTTWAQTSTITTVTNPAVANPNTPWKAGTPMYLSLRKASGVYHAAAWFQESLQPGLIEVSGTPSAFTPAYIYFGRLHGTGSAKMILDWFRKTA